jgi:hypothetical protein
MAKYHSSGTPDNILIQTTKAYSSIFRLVEMKNSKISQKEATIASWGAIGVGLLLLVIGLFLDPIGSDPDTGIFDLGVTGTKLLIGAFGMLLLIVGIRDLFKSKHDSSKY